ncbi:MAG: carbamoyl phosphate synthase small subunit [Spirochaetes bacterium]|nr:MAG: carbamoyl phosphate synthase small subunit [Spirochaetota bacterium]
MDEQSFLVLAGGAVFPGRAFGAEAPSADDLGPGAAGEFGEVVFNTGMSGYVEIVTDPSYTGQIVVMTYPHIGNYGVDPDWFESLGTGGSADGITGLSGFVVRSLYRGKVPEGRQTLHDFLTEAGVPGISGVDTRALTLKLRDEGSINGIIVRGTEDRDSLAPDEKAKVLSFLSRCPSMEGCNLVSETGTTAPVEYNSGGSPHIAVVDCGIKENILRSLLSRGCRVTAVPSDYTSREILNLESDGVLISNGPGDPAVLTEIIHAVKELIGKVPLSGICLGHQILGLALGADTVKMKFGHHGINHPVRNMENGNVLITSQNHGFMIDESTLPEGVDVWMRNSNDNTVEGIKHRELSILSTQFHPEAAPGPHDSLWIFDEIIKTAEEA